MTAMDSMLGRPGDPVQCKTWPGGASIHWWQPDAVAGDPCLCGEREMKPRCPECGDSLDPDTAHFPHDPGCPRTGDCTCPTPPTHPEHCWDPDCRGIE